MGDSSVGKVIAFTIVITSYACHVVRHQPVGITRLLLALPVIMFFTAMPLTVDSVIVRGGLGFLLSWLANFKLLAFSAGRGPLALPGLSVLQWAAMLVLPIYPAKRGKENVSTLSVLLSFPVKLCVIAGLTLLLSVPEIQAYGWLRHAGYAMYVWMFVSVMADAAVPLGGRLLNGVPLQVSMDRPLMSRSINEFWGMRYNQIVSCSLFHTVYLPILDGCWISKQNRVTTTSDSTASQQGNAEQTPQQESEGAGLKQPHTTIQRSNPAVVPTIDSLGTSPIASTGQQISQSQRAAALFSAFAVSGLMHELIVCMMCRRVSSTGKLTAFFLLQPILILIETPVKRALLPVWLWQSQVGFMIEVCITLLVILASAELLFWEALESCEIDEQGLQEVGSLLQYLQGVTGL